MTRVPLARRAASFPRRLRLVRAADFAKVFSKPSSSARDGALTLLAKRTSHPHPRLGLAVSRRYVGSAVARNRIKRVIRESFRRHQHSLGNLDIVVIARRGTEERSTQNLRSDLEALWNKLIRS